MRNQHLKTLKFDYDFEFWSQNNNFSSPDFVLGVSYGAPYGVQNPAYSPVQPMGAWGMQAPQAAPSPYGGAGRPLWETFYDEQGTPYYYHTQTG